MNVPTIYVVDDDAAVRDSLELLLESHGMNVEAFESTEAFAARFRRQGRQCLVLDQHLQGLKTGLDFVEQGFGGASPIPVILVTGRGDTALKARAMAAGVIAYLDKPVDVDQLIAEINRALSSAG